MAVLLLEKNADPNIKSNVSEGGRDWGRSVCVCWGGMGCKGRGISIMNKYFVCLFSTTFAIR